MEWCFGVEAESAGSFRGGAEWSGVEWGRRLGWLAEEWRDFSLCLLVLVIVRTVWS